MSDNQIPESDQQKYLLLCPNSTCLSIPKMSISSGLDLKFECTCHYDETLKLKDYLKSLKTLKEKVTPPCSNLNHSDKSSINYCPKCCRYLCEECLSYHQGMEPSHTIFNPDFKYSFKCEKHKLKYNYFCQNCKAHLCETCKIKHNSKHNIIELSTLITDETMKKIGNDLNSAKEKLKKHYETLKNEAIKSLIEEMTKIKKQISRIEEECMKCVDRNKDLVQLFTYFFENVEQTKDYMNYYCITNLQNHYNLNLEKFNNKNHNIEDLIEYFQNDNIVKTIPFFSSQSANCQINLKSIQRIKKIEISKNQNTCIYMISKEKIIIGDSAGMLRVFNKESEKVESEINAHKNEITYISELKDGNFITSSKDNLIKIWDSEKLDSEYTLKSHKNAVLKTAEILNNIISCSTDKTIKIWVNSPDYALKNTLILKGDEGYPTNFINISESKLLASYSSGIMAIWDLDKLKVELKIDGILSPSSDALYLKDENNVLIGGKGKIWIYNLNENIVIKSKAFSKLGLVKSFKNVNDGGFICLCENDIFNFNTSLNAISTKNGFKGDYVSLDSESTIISLEDKFVNIWKC